MTTIRRDHGETVDGTVGMEFLAAFYVPEWYGDALCAEVDSELFFPDIGASVVAAKKICAECPVREQCDAQAVENGERWGIWGGRSEYDRRKARKAARLREAS